MKKMIILGVVATVVLVMAGCAKTDNVNLRGCRYNVNSSCGGSCSHTTMVVAHPTY